jgi:hypothetical protein
MYAKERVEISVGQVDGAAEGAFADGAQHLGALFDAMLGAGVTADGESKNEIGSVMKVVVLSDGELTPVWRSKQNVDFSDVDSLHKAESRFAVENLEEP